MAIYTPEGFFVTTLSQDLNSSSTTVNLTAVPGVATTGYLVIEPASATKREVVHFTSVGVSSVTTADDTTDASDASGRGCSGSINAGAATTHAQGATVLIAAVDQYWERLIAHVNAIVSTSGVPDLNGAEFIIDADADTSMTADTDDQIDWKLGGSDRFRMGVSDFDIVTATGNIQVSGADPSRTMYVPASAMFPSTTAPCAAITQVEAATNDVNIKVLDFDGAGTSKEYAEFGIQSPSYWDAGTITAQFIWFASAGSGTVNWELQGLALSDDDALDAAYGTLQEVTDTLLATGDVHISAETSAITIAGTPAAGDWLQFKVARDPANDTNTSDARLMGIRIRFKIKQYNDA